MQKLGSEYLNNWRKKNLSHQNFLIILSLFIGIIGALSAVLLKNLVFYTSYLLKTSFSPEQFNYLYLGFPIIGIFLTYLFVKYIVKDKISHGVSRILWSISKNNSNIKRHNTWTSMVASTLTVGFGGSVGLEAPIVLTGSAIGSNVGQYFSLDSRSKTILLACGAAGAMAAIFKAPVAAVVFALEVLMLDLTMASLLPLLIASLAGTSVSYFLIGESVMFSYSVKTPFNLTNIPFYLLLGIFAGFVSLYFTKSAFWVEKIFKNIPNYTKKLISGGILLGVLIFIFPILYGEGYESISALLNSRYTELLNNTIFWQYQGNSYFVLLFLLLILIFKVIAMAITNGAGGNGGIFAPSLFMGAITGYFLAVFLKTIFNIDVPYENFVLAGMAGIMSGVMHSPLTAIFLIAELSGGYNLFVPLMITSSISYLTVMPFEPHSIYTKKLAAKGELTTHHKDKTALSKMRIDEILETNFIAISDNDSLRNIIEAISKSNRNIFPVINNQNRFLGLVFLDDIRDKIFKPELYDITYTKDLLVYPEETINIDENINSVVKKFRKTGYYNIPVIDKDKTYLGFISRANFYTKYKDIIESMSED